MYNNRLRNNQYSQILVNKSHLLTRAFVPDRMLGEGKTMMYYDAMLSLNKMIRAASSQKIELVPVSGYRSYTRQKQLYINSMVNSGIEHAIKYVAPPGASEHQTGLAMDISCKEIELELTEEFAGTRAGKWLKRYSVGFGFILRYPKEYEYVTGFEYEPWHYRYVGINTAKMMAKRRIITLEEWWRE